MTLKQFAKQNSDELDAKFRQRYPQGRFTVQVINGGGKALHLNQWRHCGYSKGSSHVQERRDGKLEATLTGQWLANGVKHFDSLAECLAVAVRKGFTARHIEAFKVRCSEVAANPDADLEFYRCTGLLPTAADVDFGRGAR